MHGMRQLHVRAPVVFCHISECPSFNKYCGVSSHAISCYQSMYSEVQKMTRTLQKSIYEPIQPMQNEALALLQSKSNDFLIIDTHGKARNEDQEESKNEK